MITTKIYLANAHALRIAAVAAIITISNQASAQIIYNSNWVGNSSGEGNWSNNNNWNPNSTPNNSSADHFNVTITRNPNGATFNGPILDIYSIVDNLTLVNGASVYIPDAPNQGSLLVNGTTTLSTTPGHAGEYGILSVVGGYFALGTLTNYNAATHTLESGSYAVSNFGEIKFRGADILTNNAFIHISGPREIPDGVWAYFANEDTGNEAFTRLAVNNGVLEFIDGFSFNTVGDFTNNGVISTGGQTNATTTFTIYGTLTNYNPATYTLTGGTYNVDVGSGSGLANIRFYNADIRALSNTNVNLHGAGASFTDYFSGLSAFRNLERIELGSSFTSGATQTYTPPSGTFTNLGKHIIDSGGYITVQGIYLDEDGSVTLIGGPTDNSDTRLVITDRALINGGSMDMGGQPGVNTTYTSKLQVINGIECRGAALTGTGTILADVLLTQGAKLQPGHSPGQLTFNGSLTMDSDTTTEIQIGDVYPPGVEYDQIVQNNGTLTLGGQLLVSFLNGYEKNISPDDFFYVITSSQSMSGSFTNISAGGRLLTSDGYGSFRVGYPDNSNTAVVLDQFFPVKIVSLTHPASHTVHLKCLGISNAVNTIESSADPSPASFMPLVSVQADANGVFQYDDTSAGTKKFYRLSVN